MLFKKKKAQVWTMDFLAGLMLFIIITLITVKVVYSLYPSQDHIAVYRDAVHTTDVLLSKGYPINWTNDTVLLPGISYNNRIDKRLLFNFSEIDYFQSKALLQIKSDYIFFIQNSTQIINTSRCVYGYPIETHANCTPILTSISYENLVKINRLIIYNSSVMQLTVYVWN